MTLQITRCQFPVGQGCFHAGSVSVRECSNTLHYVYDCGSTNQKYLRRQVNRYREYTSSIDALFVSHFDSDHVSGLDELLGTVHVKTAYIPYVSDLVLLLDIMEADMDGGVSGSLIEISFNPATWFGLRGVQRVVRVLPGPPDIPSLEEAVDDDDDEPRNGDLWFVERPAPKTVLSHPYKGKMKVRSELLKMDPGSILVRFRKHSTEWALVPYVHPAPVARMEDFERELRSILGLQNDQEIESEKLAIALRDPSVRRVLRRCYDRIISGGARRLHNRISMSLYSGPIKRLGGDAKAAYWIPYHGGLPVLLPFRGFWISRSSSEGLGWLGTGDADLNTEQVRVEWQKAYQSVKSRVSTLLLPHHGSCRNFHPDLLDFPNLELCVASAARPSQYMHPSEETIGMINRQRKGFVHVSQHYESQLVEEITIR